MSTQGDRRVVEGSEVRGEALVFAELGTARPKAQEIWRPASRGSVALFTDSFVGIGAVAAKSLVRDGYAVRLYVR